MSAIPITFTCDDVLSAQELYDYNPNVLFDQSLVQANGPGIEYSKKFSGLLCTYVNETSRDTVTLSISQLNNDGTHSLEEQAKLEALGTVEIGSNVAYFTRSEGLGLYKLFSGKYFVTTASPQYSAESDGVKFLSTIQEQLP